MSNHHHGVARGMGNSDALLRGTGYDSVNDDHFSLTRSITGTGLIICDLPEGRGAQG